MFFEDIFPAFFQYASGEDCFESDEYIHEALFEIGRITNIQHKKAFVKRGKQTNQIPPRDMTEFDTIHTSV